jgi:hypothetical protein
VKVRRPPSAGELVPGARALVFGIWASGPRLVEVAEQTDDRPGSHLWYCTGCASTDCAAQRFLCRDVDGGEAEAGYIFTACELVAVE